MNWKKKKTTQAECKETQKYRKKTENDEEK